MTHVTNITNAITSKKSRMNFFQPHTCAAARSFLQKTDIKKCLYYNTKYHGLISKILLEWQVITWQIMIIMRYVMIFTLRTLSIKENEIFDNNFCWISVVSVAILPLSCLQSSFYIYFFSFHKILTEYISTVPICNTSMILCFLKKITILILVFPVSCNREVYHWRTCTFDLLHIKITCASSDDCHSVQIQCHHTIVRE